MRPHSYAAPELPTEFASEEKVIDRAREQLTAWVKEQALDTCETTLATGTITAGGALGILIPPSIMLVVMGPTLEVPVTNLFAAAIVPGIMGYGPGEPSGMDRTRSGPRR